MTFGDVGTAAADELELAVLPRPRPCESDFVSIGGDFGELVVAVDAVDEVTVMGLLLDSARECPVGEATGDLLAKPPDRTRVCEAGDVAVVVAVAVVAFGDAGAGGGERVGLVGLAASLLLSLLLMAVVKRGGRLKTRGSTGPEPIPEKSNAEQNNANSTQMRQRTIDIETNNRH